MGSLKNFRLVGVLGYIWDLALCGRIRVPTESPKKPLGKEGEALFAVEIPGLKRLGREAETCHHVAVVVPEKRRIH